MERGSLGMKYTDRTPALDRHMQAMIAGRGGWEESPPAPQMFGNAGREHMERYGSKPEHFAWIGYKNHKHSVNNPYAQFQVEYTLGEIKEKVLPALDDAFANKLLPGKSLAELRHTIEHDLEHEKEHEVERAKEAQIVKYLHEKIQFDLPPSLLRNETKRALTELVQRNRARGIPDEMLKDKEKELIETAASVAHHRLKTNFILERIAEQEEIKVRREDVDLRIRQEAQNYNISSDKMRKELEEHDGLNAFAEQILLGKTLDFLKANVSVQPVSEEQTAKK